MGVDTRSPKQNCTHLLGPPIPHLRTVILLPAQRKKKGQLEEIESGGRLCKARISQEPVPGSPTLSRRVLIVFNQPRQPEISNLANESVPHQNVGRSQVSVDVIHPLDVSHSCSHLGKPRGGHSCHTTTVMCPCRYSHA